MIAAASAKTRTKIIAVNIRGADEGFLPKAVMLALAQEPKTQHGPSIQKIKIRSNDRLRSISLFFHDNSGLIPVKPDYPSAHRIGPSVNDQAAADQTADHRFMVRHDLELAMLPG